MWQKRLTDGLSTPTAMRQAAAERQSWTPWMITAAGIAHPAASTSWPMASAPYQPTSPVTTAPPTVIASMPKLKAKILGAPWTGG